MLAEELRTAIQRHIARGAINASSMRSSPKGTVRAARKFLGDLDLEPFGVCEGDRFLKALDPATDDLRRDMPKGRWGFARKGLNIFLRGCLYNLHLRERYHLDWSQLFLEIPLDRIVSTEIRRHEPTVPRWKNIRDLKIETSNLYQEAALRISRRQNCPRVYLDSVWYGAHGDIEAGDSSRGPGA